MALKKGKIEISKLAIEKLIKYRQIVQQMLLEYGKRKPARGDIEVETILDTERARYQIFYVGWDNQTGVHHCSIHIDIKSGKIWIHIMSGRVTAIFVGAGSPTILAHNLPSQKPAPTGILWLIDRT